MDEKNDTKPITEQTEEQKQAERDRVARETRQGGGQPLPDQNEKPRKSGQ